MNKYKRRNSNIKDLVIVLAFLTLIALLILIPCVTKFTGFYENYSQGYRDGIITKASTKGVFFKTNELILQVTIGEDYTRQIEQIEMSCPEEEIWKKIHKQRGKKIRVYYSEWLVSPISLGSSRYHVINIENLDEESGK